MAAVHMYHLTQNHPFNEGNKRVGAATALLFLKWNGFRLTVSNEEFYKIAVCVAGRVLKS